MIIENQQVMMAREAILEICPPAATEIREFLIRPDTNRHIREALRRTNTEGFKFGGKLLGREFGFAGFGDFSTSGSIHLSPLFEGQESSVEIYALSQLYLTENVTVPTSTVFDFHSHTYLYPRFLRDLGDREALEADEREIDYFSIRDFRSYFYHTRDNPFYIRALGTERDGKGRILVISFNSHQACRDFDYEGVYGKSKYYLQGGLDPLSAYREAGLNVAVIGVDLMCQVALNSDDVDEAAFILTQRR